MREDCSCQYSYKITRSQTPCHVTPLRRFGPSFLVMLLCETFGAHQPLNHQRKTWI